MKCTSGKWIIASLISLISVNVHADWQCYVVDQGRHYWESKGSTPERANAVALSFCSAYSPNGSSCQPSKCFEKP